MSDLNLREDGIAFLEEALNRSYKIACRDSHPDDFASNLEQYESYERSLSGLTSRALAGKIFDSFASMSLESATHEAFLTMFRTVHFAEDNYESWLRNGNCPPPQSPNAGSEGQAFATNAGSGTAETKTNGDSDKSKNSTKGFLIENWKGFAVAGGLLATTWALWGVSVLLVADDVTGVGAVDDPALALTVPAASAATAATIESAVLGV